MDLPRPWVVIPSVHDALIGNGKFCGFSPCIEQVQKTCEALRSFGFMDIYTIEVLNRPYDVRSVSVESIKLDNVVDSINKTENESNEANKKRTREEEETKEAKDETNENKEESESNDSKMEESEPKTEAPVEDMKVETKTTAKKRKYHKKLKTKTENRALAKPILDTRGHTGFLTFARKPVLASVQPTTEIKTST